MKRSRPLTRDDFAEIQRSGSSAKDNRTLDPPTFLGSGCLTTLVSTVVSQRLCVSTYQIRKGNGSKVSFNVKHYVDADTAKQNSIELAAVAALEESQHDDETGLCVWPASFLLMEWLASRDLAMQTVLELGAGCGIVGIAAGCLSARSTVITDGSKEAVKLMDENIATNTLDGPVRSALRLWGQDDCAGEDKYDIVLACEVFCVCSPPQS